jgi:hypothetical protein
MLVLVCVILIYAMISFCSFLTIFSGNNSEAQPSRPMCCRSYYAWRNDTPPGHLACGRRDQRDQWSVSGQPVS